MNVSKRWLDTLGTQFSAAKNYDDTRHTGILFVDPPATRPADRAHERAFKIVLSLLLVTFSMATESTGQTPSGPININGQNGTVIDNLHITNPTGDCLTITNSTNITVRRSEIGPCGGNGINFSGRGTINIYDSYIHPEKPLSTSCCDTHDGILILGTSGLKVQGNVIGYGSAQSSTLERCRPPFQKPQVSCTLKRPQFSLANSSS